MDGIEDLKIYIDLQNTKKNNLDFEIQAFTRKFKPGDILINKSPYRPRTLFKYYSPETYNLKALEEGKVWMSRPDNFNDPYDCAFKLRDDINNLSMGQSLKSFKDRIAITCYSENSDSILMWSHYARNHQGFCVEYDFGDVSLLGPKHYDRNYSMILAPVIYGKRELIEITNNQENDSYAILKMVYSKAFDWIYEQEWRQVLITQQALNGGFLSPSADIKTIVLGCKIDSFVEKIIYRMCLEKGIKLEKMRMHEDKFFLERIGIIN